MDEFTINISSVTTKKDKEVVEPLEEQESHMTITDQKDGTYLAQFTYPRGGTYEISVVFEGRFNLHIILSVKTKNYC